MRTCRCLNSTIEESHKLTKKFGSQWPLTLPKKKKNPALYRAPKLRILQGSSTGPDLKANESSPHPHVVFLEDPF